MLLAEGERFRQDGQITLADVDLDLLRQERARWARSTTTAAQRERPSIAQIAFALKPPADDIGFLRRSSAFPFVPDDASRLEQDCYEAYNIQVAGLVQRTARDRHRSAS